MPSIPEHWQMLRVKNVGKALIGLTYGPEDVVDDADEGTLVLRAGNIQDGRLQLTDNVYVAKPVPDDLRLRPSDIVVCARNGSAHLIGKNAVATSEVAGQTWGAFMAVLRSAHNNYLRWVLNSRIFAAQAGLFATATINQLTSATLHNLRFAMPTPSEQRAISEFLDRETARIDTLIDEQQRLIEMLRERRGAVISSAVVRGLDETVALKDSGLPGAGPVPAHWEIIPLRYTISFQEGPGIMAADFRDEGVPLLRVSCVRSVRSTLEGCNYLDPNEVDRRWSHFRVDRGDLLISASASMGTVSEVTEETAGSVPYTGIIRIKPGRMNKDFIRWFVVSGEFLDQVDSLKTGSTIQHFGPTHLAQMRVALPPTDEQCQISAYLDDQTAKIDTLIAEAERFIELSKERRSALITAAVTGQIDVREMV